MSVRVIEQITARPASDGDGVKLKRVFGGHRSERFDPFLMMDEFGSESAEDYIGGFPPHPHRGFETITYMLQGKMEHRDHMENVGLLNDGDVQWMTAGRGVIHSEMPKQTEGKMRGFQLWLNLPAIKKMQDARYQDVPSGGIPLNTVSGAKVKAIAGSASVNGDRVNGYFDVPDTEAVVMDIHFSDDLKIQLPEGLNTMIYVYDGALTIGSERVPSPSQTLNRLDGEGEITLFAAEKDTRFIMLAGKPLKEPIAQYGPFVMNTPMEIEQAITDYRSGQLTA